MKRTYTKRKAANIVSKKNEAVAAAARSYVHLEEIDLSKCSEGCRMKTNRVENGSVEANDKKETNIVEKIDAADDDDLITPRVNYLSKVVYLKSIKKARAQEGFPNYSSEKVENMRDFFALPNAIMLPFAKKELFTVDDVLILIEKTSKWMNCATINSYFDLIQKASNGHITCYKSFYVQPTALSSDNNRPVQFCIPPKLRDTDFFSRETLYIPYNLAGLHWVLITVNFPSKVILIYDSLDLCTKHPQFTDSVLNELLNHLCEEERYHPGATFDNVGWKGAITYCPRQTNTTDCGIFVCNMAWCLVRKKVLNFQQADIPLIRQRMAYELLCGRLLC